MVRLICEMISIMDIISSISISVIMVVMETKLVVSRYLHLLSLWWITCDPGCLEVITLGQQKGGFCAGGSLS